MTRTSTGLAALLLLAASCADQTPPPRRAEPTPPPTRRAEPRRTAPPPPARRDGYTGPTVMKTPQGKLQLPGELTYAPGTSAFATGGENETLLKSLLHYLETHPRITRIRVAGHTDSRGLASFNERISGERARAVKTWLTSHAVPAKRVVAVGCGETRPIASNRTPDGRAQNRRMELWIIEMDGKPFRGRDANGGCTPY